jgi:hypothetical protein
MGRKMSVNLQIQPDRADDVSKAAPQPEGSKALSIRARIVLGIIILWAFGTAFFIATHPPF